MRGRKPKPAARQIAEGDPSKRGVNKLDERLRSEPKASAGLPGCPRYLKGRARHAWTFWARELEAMGLDKRPDGPMLEGACRAYERAVAADLIVDKEGIVVHDKFIDDSGQAIVLKTRKHPAVEISNRSWLIVRAFCSEFGLSPVSRTRLVLDPKEAGAGGVDELAKILSQPRSPRSDHVN